MSIRALQRTAAPLCSRTVRVIWQRLLQPTGHFRRRSLSLDVRRSTSLLKAMDLYSEHKRFIESLESRFAGEPLNADDAAEILEHEFLSDPARIESLNEELRQLNAHWLANDTEPRPWPDDYFVIGDSECGDYYCVSKSRSFSGIVAYGHEMAVFTPFAADFDEYYEKMMIDFRKRADRY